MTSILQFSDVHFGVEDRAAMAAVAAMADMLEPDITIICGDITQSGKVEEFKSARKWIDSLPGLKLITPGNHDTPMFGLVQRFTQPFARYEEHIGPASQDDFFDDNVSITTLNTSRGWQFKTDWSLGVVNMDKLDERINALSRANPSALKMIACHHPLIYPPVSPLQKETKNGVAAIRRLSDANIDAVLTGHVHAPFFVDRKPGESGILSIGSGTLSTRRRGVDPSFNHIKISRDLVSVTPIAWVDGAFAKLDVWNKERALLEPNHG